MTGLHLSTVGFSVRNALVMLGGPKPELELTAWLQKYWPVPGLCWEEIADALLELERRGMVKRLPLEGWWQATDARFFRTRGREQAEMSEDDHWEGWAA